MKQPAYNRMPKALKEYWQNQDLFEEKEGFALGVVVGGIIVGIAWVISLF